MKKLDILIVVLATMLILAMVGTNAIAISRQQIQADKLEIKVWEISNWQLVLLNKVKDPSIKNLKHPAGIIQSE